MKYTREFAGEFIGTFLLALFGCGAVAVSVLFGAYKDLLQIALIWGIGVSLAIYATRHLSCAHLNPAVTLAMVTSRRMLARKAPAYIAAQFLGAFLAALTLYALFGGAVAGYEAAHGIVRGAPQSVATARMFGEFYNCQSMWLAVAAEGTGTFLLVLLIFFLTEGCNLGRPDDSIAPLLIGLTVTALICLLAPLTQAGLNPARDFAPRLVAWLCGWKSAAFPDSSGGFFWVYILAPVAGGQLAALLFTQTLEPLMKKPQEQCGCNK